MSTNRLRIKIDQENQHKIGPTKNDIRTPFEENIGNGNIPSKRPLSAKGNLNDKRVRIPFGGKDQNKFLGLQRSKSSLPSTFQSGPLKQIQPQQPPQQQQQQQQPPQPVQSNKLRQGGVLSAKPILTKSNSSLGFLNRPVSLNTPVFSAPIPRVTNPHKNNLLQPDIQPRFASDSLEKGLSKELPLLKNSLSDTFSEQTFSLHASKQKFAEPLLGNIDPMKKGARNEKIEQIIEILAEDENSIDTIPERPQVTEDYVPLGVSPLTKEQAPFLYEDSPELKWATDYPPDHKFYSDDEAQIIDDDIEENKMFREELVGCEPNHTLGLSEGDMFEMLEL